MQEKIIYLISLFWFGIFIFTDHHVPGVRHERGKRLWFDVSDVPPGEFIIGAEFRLYRDISQVKKPKYKGDFAVTVYRVLTEGG